MHEAKVIQLNEHRGRPRLWMEGSAPKKSGFQPGLRYSIRKEDAGIVLYLDEQGDRTISKKTYKSGTEMPVLDINSEQDLKPLQGASVVRVTFGQGCVKVTPLASEVRRRRRLARLTDKLENGAPLAVAGVAFGGGVLDHAVHTGLADVGIPSELAFCNEIREELTEHAKDVNDCMSPHTKVLAMPLQELAFDPEVMAELDEIDLMALGLPCSGASVAGRAKRNLGIPEEHPDVGHLVVAALALIAKVNPSAIIFENVPPYAKSASAVLIRNQLRDLGYECHEREFLGTEWGALEARKRWCLVAMTKGIDFDFESLQPTAQEQAPRKLAEVLEPPEAVAARWSEMRGLKEKEIRDAEAGKGFRMQIFTGDEAYIGTLTKGIAKNRSTDPKIQHPDNPDLLRIPTAREHARCKGVPEHLIDGLSETTAHEILGQGIVYTPFRAVSRHVGEALVAYMMEKADLAHGMSAGYRAAA